MFLLGYEHIINTHIHTYCLRTSMCLQLCCSLYIRNKYYAFCNCTYPRIKINILKVAISKCYHNCLNKR